MTRAVTIAELGDQNTFVVDGTNQRVGIASANPTVTLDVGGVVVATAFTGDGSGLTSLNVGAGGTWNSYDSNTGITTTKKVKIQNNLEVTGVVTATKFVGSGEGLIGVASTDNIITGTAATFNNTVNFGSVCSISTSGNSLNINSTDTISISGYSGATKLLSQQGSNLVVADAIGGDVELYFVTSSGPNGSEKRLETTTNGIAVAGIVTATSGIVTYYGDGSNLTNLNIPAGFTELDAALFN